MPVPMGDIKCTGCGAIIHGDQQASLTSDGVLCLSCYGFKVPEPKTTGLSFGEAMKYLADHDPPLTEKTMNKWYHVKRSGWHMKLYLCPGDGKLSFSLDDPRRSDYWVPSKIDIAATDWEIVT